MASDQTGMNPGPAATVPTRVSAGAGRAPVAGGSGGSPRTGPSDRLRAIIPAL